MSTFYFYKQHDAEDCGPTCLKMVAKFYDKNVALQYLREKMQIGKQGVNLLGISDAAESIGLRTQALKLTYDELLGNAKLPAILHWNQNHFVVLYGKKRRSVFNRDVELRVADPASGLFILTAEEFKTHWVSDYSNNRQEGIAVLLEPSPAFYTSDLDN